MTDKLVVEYFETDWGGGGEPAAPTSGGEGLNQAPLGLWVRFSDWSEEG